MRLWALLIFIWLMAVVGFVLAVEPWPADKSAAVNRERKSDRQLTALEARWPTIELLAPKFTDRVPVSRPY